MVESIKELREICQSIDQEKKYVSYSGRFARKISIYFTKALLYTSITGNQVTLLFILIGLFAGTFFIHGNPFYTLIGALLLQLWYIFDHVDGEVARYRGTESITGTYLDFLSHYVVHPYIFICITFGIYNIFHQIVVFVFGFLAFMAIVLIDAIQDCVYKAVILTRMGISRESVQKTVEKQAVKLKESGPYPPLVRRIDPFLRYIPFYVPGIINLILVAAVIDVLLTPHIRIGPFTFNSMYLVVFLYGIITTLFWITSGLLVMKMKSADKLYYSLFESQNEDQRKTTH